MRPETKQLHRRPIRWMGSKQHRVRDLVPLLQAQLADGARCVAPFYGSGALEQAAFPGTRVLAAEANAHLVAFHTQLGLNPGRLWRTLLFLDRCSRRLADGPAAYARIASMTPRSSLEAAVRFLWLNGTSWSGMYRENRSGRFNAPPDHVRLARRWPFPGLPVLERASVLVRGTTFRSTWQTALAEARAGDLVIADPPYAGGFVEYTAARFSDADQVSLERELRRAADRGAIVIAFNSLAAAQWYPAPWTPATAPRSGRINSRGALRAPVDELVATLGWRTVALPAVPSPAERISACR
jgi:DNA adenine methylase